MRSDPTPILAAGVLMWRPSRKHGIRIALVHRPRYGDWSLPKGKAEAAESPQVTAGREAWEETGWSCALGRSLTTVSYVVAGGSKTVRYFAARALEGKFAENREVDKLAWLSPAGARRRMSYEFDQAVLDTFLLEPADLATVVLVRHARAGHRESYAGVDQDRPLDTKGDRQAQALVAEILPFAPQAVHSAPLERCTATVAPLAERLGVAVQPQPALAEDAYRDDPAAARRRLVDLASGGPAAERPIIGAAQPDRIGGAPRVVVCSQGGVIPGVVKSLAGQSDVPAPVMGTPKASFWVLSFDGRKLVQADRFPPPEV